MGRYHVSRTILSQHTLSKRIRQIKFSDPENCLYAPDVIDFAREGFYKGSDRDFSFQRLNPYTPGGLRGCEARVWAFFNKFSDDMERAGASLWVTRR